MKSYPSFVTAAVVTLGMLAGCNNSEPNATNTAANTQGEGTLTLVANGEDFVREGFVTKDGWRVDFDHVYVTLDQVEAHVTEPPFDPDADAQLQAQETVTLVEEPVTVDLAADNVVVAETQAPAGTYNALSWQLAQTDQGTLPQQTIILEGEASKDGETIPFVIGFDQAPSYVCGEFVGDQRKGIVEADSEADVETTFHFDHIFGDAETSLDDPLNQEAVGFEPFAELASNGQIQADMAQLQQQMSPDEFQKLQTAIVGLGHVGEGHCAVAEG